MSAASLLWIATAFPALAQSPSTTFPGPGETALYGSSVATDGDLLVIGAPGDDTNAENAGLVKVYQASTGILLHTLLNPSPSANDNFGYAVAISGNRIVVGAYLDSTGATSAGTVYVYDLTTPSPTVPVLTLNKPAPILAEDRFGNAVGISGTYIVVGAYQSGASDVGSAYIYSLTSLTPTTPIATLNNPTPLSSAWFGSSVAISGSRVVVGASGNDVGAAAFAGQAFIYDAASPTPAAIVHTINNPAAAAFDSFGASVSISGTRVVIGANHDDTNGTDSGSAYVYEIASGTPTLVATLNNPAIANDDWFGSSVAISGLRVVVGALNNDTGGISSGRAYVYSLLPGLPYLTLENPTPASSDWFGTSVAVSGTNVLVGAPGHNLSPPEEDDSGSAYLYRFPLPQIPATITRLSNGHMTTQFNALTGLNFELRRSTNLTSWPFSTTIIAGPSGISYTDTAPPQPCGFYRLMLP